jgi:hypothetical protein
MLTAHLHFSVSACCLGTPPVAVSLRFHMPAVRSRPVASLSWNAVRALHVPGRRDARVGVLAGIFGSPLSVYSLPSPTD